MPNVTAKRAMQTVQSEAEKIRNDETAAVGTMSVGDVVRQGDLYLVAIARLPATATPASTRQLAPGTTQGSRHVAMGGQVYDTEKSETLALVAAALPGTTLFAELIGPVIEAAEPVEIDHPEHGNRVLPAGTYAVVYQRAFGEEVRRQAD